MKTGKGIECRARYLRTRLTVLGVYRRVAPPVRKGETQKVDNKRINGCSRVQPGRKDIIVLQDREHQHSKSKLASFFLRLAFSNQRGW